jgi:hypothetical protein
MTSHSRNQPNLIKNGLYPWAFHSPNLLKFAIDIINNLLGILGRGTHSSSTFITTISNMAFGFT